MCHSPPPPPMLFYTHRNTLKEHEKCAKDKTVGISIACAVLFWSLMYTHYDGAVSIFHRTSAWVNSQDGQSLPKEKLYDTSFVRFYGTQLTFGVYVKISVFSSSFLEYSSLQWFFSTDIHRLSVCKTKRLLWGFFHKVMKTQGIKSLKE